MLSCTTPWRLICPFPGIFGIHLSTVGENPILSWPGESFIFGILYTTDFSCLGGILGNLVILGLSLVPGPWWSTFPLSGSIPLLHKSYFSLLISVHCSLIFCSIFSSFPVSVIVPFVTPREDAGGLSREYVLRIPACRKRRLKGRRYIAIVADTA